MSAGVMARSVSDIAMFNKIFSICNSTLPSVTLAGEIAMFHLHCAMPCWQSQRPLKLCIM
jgi:hypothetical protein